ncbi:MAG TPA: membrane protein insertase YidC, partial [Vicinamibacterales bacterium]
MEKRVFIAVLLSFLILAAYQTYFAPSPTKTNGPAGTTPAITSTPAPSSGASVSPAPSPGASAAAPAPSSSSAPAASDAVIADTAPHDIVVETDDVIAVFSTEGGVLKSWKLKHYLASPDSKGSSPLLDLVPSDVPGDKP